MDLRKRRVLVTGADGFIGSHLVERLVTLGARVRAFCLYTSLGEAGWLEEVPAGVRRRIEIVRGDVRDARFVDASMKGVDTAFHLAALIAIPYSYQAPESFIDTNVRGTLNVLEAARRHKIRRLVHTSTSEVYGTPVTIPIRESHPMNAQSPYAASKVAADQLALAWHRSYGVPSVILRPFNTYGPRQSARAVLPTILVQLLRGETTVALGRLDIRRDMTYVADTVEGFVAAGSVPDIEGATIHLGTNRAVSISDLFRLAKRVLRVKAGVRLDSSRLRPEASEVLVLRSDPARARKALGWKARVPLEEGIRRTADWLRGHLDRYRENYRA